MRKVLQVAENDFKWELEDDSSGYEENEELLDVLHLRGKRSPQFAGTNFFDVMDLVHTYFIEGRFLSWNK